MLFSKLRQIKKFPCGSCPFILAKEKKGKKYAFCSVYSNQETVGIESCQEVSNYILVNGNKKLFLETLSNGKLILSF